MFRDRPLTWLFIAATICVDWVLIVVIEGNQGFISSVKIGLVLGQLAALAIWSVRGRMHRLARMSYLILVTVLLTYLIDAAPEPKTICFAFYSGYVLWTIFVTLVGDFIRHRLRENSLKGNPSRRWQVPLIEFFGWTTVVAILSFSVRHMDFSFLQRSEALEIVVLLFAIPTCLTLFTQRDLIDLKVFKVVLLLFVVLAATVYVAKNRDEGKYAIIFQSAYLVLWLPVLSMDAALSRRKSEKASLPQQSTRTEKPKLFDPQD